MAHAQEGWIDVTSQYIINPNYDNDSNKGWEGTTIGHAQPAQAAEHWNTSFNSYQHISNLPNGKYRVTVNALYRPGNSDQYLLDRYLDGDHDIPAHIYANEVTRQVIPCYSQYLTHDANGAHYLYNREIDEYVWYPNSMYSGVAAFEDGLYINELEVDVTDRTLTIGIASDAYVQYGWCLFDNWKLEKWGSIVPVTAITLSQTELEMSLGETTTITAAIEPEDATYRKLKWTSSNTKVVQVNAEGELTAISEGKAFLTVSATDDFGATATCTVTVSKNAASSESLVINEIMVDNIDTYLDPSFNYGSFVELYNPTSKGAGLAHFYISDDADNLTKFHLPITIGAIPAGGYFTLWFDHYDWNYSRNQVGFKLDPEGGTLYISDDLGALIASQDYPAAISRASYARTTDGGDTWRYTSTPSPNATNNGSTFADEQLAAPRVQQDSQLFTTPMNVRIAIPSGCQLIYTTDGSTPTLTNGTTNSNGLVVCTKTTVYRFRLFKNGMLPSPVVTRTFIKNDRGYDLPIISVVTQRDNLYSSEYGIFETGPNGRAGNGRDDKCNWNMDWDRPANFELIEEDGSMAINQEVDMAVCGGWTRASSPHSFKLKADKQYEGKSFFEHVIFPDKPYNKNKTLQIRNGGNDGGCRIKDPALQEIVARSGLDIDCQSYRPILHFINGTYNGLLNMREPNNKHFSYANRGLDSESQDQFEMSPDSGYIQMAGTKDAFLRWYELSENAADPDTYEEIKKMVDIDEFINYIGVEFYLGNWDWPKNNLKAYRPRTEDGRFRFVTFDLDGSFSVGDPFTTFEGKRIFTFDMLRGERQGEYITAEIEIVTIFLNMLENAEFRKQFIDSYCLITGSVFNPTRCAAIIRELATRVEKWVNPWSTANDLISRLNASYQATNINYLKNYSRMKLSKTTPITATFSANIDEAHLTLNGLPVPTDAFSGKLFAPITLKAQAPAGYTFKGWVSNSSSVRKEFIAKGGSWLYYDQGSLDGKSWKAANFDDRAWAKGNAPLGYFVTDKQNGRGYQSFLNYGGNDNDKYPTYYFRTTVRLSDAPGSSDVFTLDFTCDDGFVIYVNGTEAGRYLMPSGTPSFSTYASSYAPGNPDSGTLTLKSSLFKKGINIIAVELHNNAANSTDVYWDASLSADMIVEGTDVICTDEEYTIPSSGTIDLVATYEKITDEQREELGLSTVRINEVSPSNDTYINDCWKKEDWIELYNATAQDVDLTGMFLSDDTLDLHKYCIPACDGIDNIIPAYGFKVVWCDKLEPVTQVHAAFKLASEGGYVLLTSSDDSHTDCFEYPACRWDQTIGLYPDGGAETYVMLKPTIGASNAITTADSSHEQQHPGFLGLILTEADEPTADDTLYDLFGRRVTAPQSGAIYIHRGQKVLWK